jgi:protein TonB
VQGAVTLEAILDATGKVESVRVLESVPLLDDAALRAVRQWRYTPTELNGVPVPVLMTVTIRFSLDR